MRPAQIDSPIRKAGSVKKKDSNIGRDKVSLPARWSGSTGVRFKPQPTGGQITMLKLKDTLRSTVNLSFDGRVFKNYHGPDAKTRFENEVRILKYLQKQGCDF